MTVPTYGDLIRVKVGARVRFLFDFAISDTGTIVPAWTEATVVANDMLGPTETVTLRLDDAVIREKFPTVDVGPNGEGEAGRAEMSVVEVIG